MKRTLSLICLAILISATASAAEDVITPQPDDEKTVTTTVGAMRRALWYYEQYLVLKDAYAEMSDAADALVVELRDAHETNMNLQAELEAANRRAFAAAVVGFALTVMLVVGLLLK